MYSMYSSFLVINVCNQGKTLCSPCILLLTIMTEDSNKNKSENRFLNKFLHEYPFLELVIVFIIFSCNLNI